MWRQRWCVLDHSENAAEGQRRSTIACLCFHGPPVLFGKTTDFRENPWCPQTLLSGAKHMPSVVRCKCVAAGLAQSSHFRTILAVNLKHCMLNYSCLKLKEHRLRVRGEPGLGALRCGNGQPMLFGPALSTLYLVVLL